MAVFFILGRGAASMASVVPGDDAEKMLEMVFKVFPKKCGNPHSIDQNDRGPFANGFVIKFCSVKALGVALLEHNQLS